MESLPFDCCFESVRLFLCWLFWLPSAESLLTSECRCFGRPVEGHLSMQVLPYAAELWFDV